MKKIIREVKDFKPYITERNTCSLIAFIISFFLDYIPLAMGATVAIWLLMLAVLFVYSYFICKLAYIIFSPKQNRIRKAEFAIFLINQGKDIDVNKKWHIAFVIPFKKKVWYKVKINSGKKVIFIFDIKNNFYYEVINDKESMFI